MKGAVFVAIAASIGNMLQGWDNATIAGSLLYIKKEFSLESEPTMEGLIVAMSLIGATVITTCSGPISDSVGRRPMLILSSVLYFVSGLVMLWAPNVYFLLLARLLDGFGIGLAVTLVPVYISETAPPEIRGSLNTLPQFTKICPLPLKWFAIGQCWCYERMTRGRRREHYQWNMDIIGVPEVTYTVNESMSGRLMLMGVHEKDQLSCMTGNNIDDCWRCEPNWQANRQHLADCGIGFGQEALGGKGGQFYTVTDSSDNDPKNPKPGTLRHAVIDHP